MIDMAGPGGVRLLPSAFRVSNPLVPASICSADSLRNCRNAVTRHTDRVCPVHPDLPGGPRSDDGMARAHWTGRDMRQRCAPVGAGRNEILT